MHVHPLAPVCGRPWVDLGGGRVWRTYSDGPWIIAYEGADLGWRT